MIKNIDRCDIAVTLADIRIMDKLDELVEENNRTKYALLNLLKQVGWEEGNDKG